MNSLLIHGGGIAECPNCERSIGSDRGEARKAFDCQMCGALLDTIAGHTRSVYELVVLPPVGHAMDV